MYVAMSILLFCVCILSAGESVHSRRDTRTIYYISSHNRKSIIHAHTREKNSQPTCMYASVSWIFEYVLTHFVHVYYFVYYEKCARASNFVFKHCLDLRLLLHRLSYIRSIESFHFLNIPYLYFCLLN